jgi:hypothetical protein
MSRSDKILKMIETIMSFDDDKLDAVDEAIKSCKRVQMLQEAADRSITKKNLDE